MTEVKCVAPTGCLLGAGPVWSPSEGFLWWPDIKRAKLHRHNPKTGNTRRYDLPIHASALTLSEGRLLMLGDREAGYYDAETESYQRLTTFPDEPVGNRTSDGGIAPDGSLWFGTMDNAENLKRGRYLRLDKNTGAATYLDLDAVRVTSTFVFSPDQRVFYTSDTAAQEILAYDYDPQNGTLSQKRVFASTATSGCFPVGGAIDEEGGLWSAHWAGSRIVRYTPDGAVDRVVNLPVSRPTACTFGGADMKTLFITTARTGLNDAAMQRQPLAGCLFSIETEIAGLTGRAWGNPVV